MSAHCFVRGYPRRSRDPVFVAETNGRHPASELRASGDTDGTRQFSRAAAPLSVYNGSVKEEPAMSMQVLVEPLADGSGFRASTGAPLNLTATGKSPEEALEEVGRRVAELWDRGARIYTLPGIPPNRRTERTAVDEEMEQIYREEIEKYRDQCDREAEERYGVKIEHSAQ
jgi:hypothetical protein